MVMFVTGSCGICRAKDLCSACCTVVSACNSVVTSFMTGSKFSLSLVIAADNATAPVRRLCAADGRQLPDVSDNVVRAENEVTLVWLLKPRSATPQSLL